MQLTVGRSRTGRKTFTGRILRHGFGGHGVRCSRAAVVRLVGGLKFGIIASFCGDLTSRSVSVGRIVSGCVRLRGVRGKRTRRIPTPDTSGCGVPSRGSVGTGARSSILIVSRGLGKLSFALTGYYRPVCKSRIFNFIAVGNNVGVRHYSYPGTARVRGHFNCHVIGTH